MIPHINTVEINLRMMKHISAFRKKGNKWFFSLFLISLLQFGSQLAGKCYERLHIQSTKNIKKEIQNLSAYYNRFYDI